MNATRIAWSNAQAAFSEKSAELENALNAPRFALDETMAALPDIVLDSNESEDMPQTCALTGLPILAGDDLVGEPEYGMCILREAVDIRPGLPVLPKDPEEESA
jgi:hypothetical protein